MDNKELLKKQIGGQAVINTQKQSQAQVNMTAPVMQMPLEQQKQNNNVQKQKEQVEDPIHKGQELEWAKFSDVGDFVNVETDDLLYLKQVVEDFLPEALNKNSSFAMKLVGERMQELSRVLTDRTMTEEEKEANTAFVLDNLCKVCIRYKKAKFKSGIKPKNKRHKTVAMINNLADAAYKKLKGKELSLHNKNIRDQKDILDHMGGSRLKAVRAEIKSLDNFLNTEIPLNEEKLKKARNDMLNNGFGELLERFNQYLESHISFSRENEERFRYAYKVYDQYRLQQKYLESLDYDTIYRLKKAGVKTWKELISRDAKEILEPKKVEETVREEKQECTEEVKASLLAAAFGSEAYKKFVKTEKDGKTVYVSEEKKLLTKAEMVEQAKADKLIIQYSTQALLQTNEVQILDMLMGVEKREETDFRYDVERTVFKGKEVLMIKGIKAVLTGAAFTEKRPGKDFMLPVYHFGIEDRVLAGITKELKAGRDKLKDFVSNLQPAEIVTKLKENGTELNEAQTEALNERISVLKQRYAEAKYSADNKYADKDLIADVERDYKTSRILANAKANAYRNVKTQEDIDSMTGSGKKMLEAKKKIATTFLGAKSKNRKTLEKAGKDGEADIVSRLYKNIEEYSAIQDTAEDKRINKLLEAERKKAAGEGGDKPTGMEALERETELLSQILKLTGEYEKLIEDKLQLSNEELENDEYSFTNEDSALEQAIKQNADAQVRTKGGIRNYLWKREKAKVEELKKQFGFYKGIRHFSSDNELHTDDSKIIYYRRKKENETGITDTDGNETGFVKEELKDVSDKPLFSHEPCAEDVCQNGLGDCWLLGTIAALVEKNPEYIKDMMEDRGDKVIVRLHNKKNKEVFVSVHKSVPKYTDGSALWVRMIEKAITASGLMEEVRGYTEQVADSFRKKIANDPTGQLKDNHSVKAILDLHDTKALAQKTAEGKAQGKEFGRTYYSLTGGEMDTAFQLLTGKQSQETLYVLGKEKGEDKEDIKKMLDLSDKEMMERYGERINELIRTIEERQNDKENKYVMIAGSYAFNTSERSGEAGENFRRGAAGPHMYTLLGVVEKDGKKMIKLRNPWGTGKVTYITQQATGIKVPVMGDELDTGTFLMEINDFAVCFKAVDMIKLTNEKQDRKV